MGSDHRDHRNVTSPMSETPEAQKHFQEPEMSATSKAMLAKVKKLVPPMLEKFHKGKSPRV